MPIYDYKCDECLNRFEAMKKVEDRKMAQCPECLTMAHHVISPVHFDCGRGLDPDFPTAYANWGKRREKLGSGRMKDTNNQKLDGVVDHEKEAWKMRKRAEQ